MTAQCALYTGALKFSGLSEYAHGYFSQHFSWAFAAFVPIDPIMILKKFEVRSTICSCDNRGTQTNWPVPGYAHAPFSPKLLMGFYSDGPVNVPDKFEVRSFAQGSYFFTDQKIQYFSRTP